MAGRGSRPGERRGGRKKGTPNRLTVDLKEMILGALADAGGRSYLAKQAVANPGAFMTLVGKVLPLQVTGEGGGPLILPPMIATFGDEPTHTNGEDRSPTIN